MTDQPDPDRRTAVAHPAELAVPKPAAAPRPSVRLGLAPTTIEDGMRLARVLACSDLVPEAFRAATEAELTKKSADVLVAIELGMELGLAPMQALQSIAVINGRPSIFGDGLLALCMGAPVYESHDEYYTVNGERREAITSDDLAAPTTAAVCVFERRVGASGTIRSVERAFSVADAKRANLLNKKGPWQEYPARMLRMRARSWAARDAFPDVLRGICSAEEAADIAPVIDTAAAPERPRAPRLAPAPAAGPIVDATALDGTEGEAV
jgi:hypothetical protein